MSNRTLIKDYIYFWFKAKRKKGHGIHSPFIFDLITEVFVKKTEKAEIITIEKLRKKLLNSKQSIEVRDLGAGSRKTHSNIRDLASIAKHSLKSKKQAKLLYRFLKYYKANTILELGTSLGISTAYFAKAQPLANITSMEGCPNIAEIAIENHKALNFENIQIEIGSFENNLPSYLKTNPKVDFIFFDGNHTKIATLEYFNQCLASTHNDTVFVFDDIYLNQGMQEAWIEIKLNSKVKASLDIFHMGFIFFRKEMTKEHFKLRF